MRQPMNPNQAQGNPSWQSGQGQQGQQFQMGQQNQAQMGQAQQANQTTNRNLIAEKELLYLQDFLSWELLAMKKCNEAAQGVMDTKIAGVIRDMGSRHQQHYQELLNQLQ
ncbi:hypothetical protein [Gorillibacterium massiliense]|uniref:hypothetical protein n=1 Tax=Gorillibacterium massiliense TaxID=1280390 RepID=UPI0004B85C23|nr:hypothetical protein [Gorillibacterium massiliense]